MSWELQLQMQSELELHRGRKHEMQMEAMAISLETLQEVLYEDLKKQPKRVLKCAAETKHMYLET